MTPSQFESAPSLVDYVFMWVDSSNRHVLQSIVEAQQKHFITDPPHAARVRDDGTFQFAVRSLLQSKLMMSIRNVYIVTSGEVPRWLTPWFGALTPDESPFTQRPLNTSLRSLIDECAGRPGHARSGQLILHPYRSLFSDPVHELPTFNSNAILATLHRIPGLSRWFIYSDDDMVVTDREVGLDFWWDSGAGGRQRLFQGGDPSVNRVRPRDSNLWDQSLTYQAALLDRMAADAAAAAGKKRMVGGPHGVSRYWPPMHMPVLLNVGVLFEMESRFASHFARTRANHVRSSDDLELNFFYQHYLVRAGYPVAKQPGGSTGVGYHRVISCGEPKGERMCKEALYNPNFRVLCFNDGGGDEQLYAAGKRVLDGALRRRFGAFPAEPLPTCKQTRSAGAFSKLVARLQSLAGITGTLTSEPEAAHNA